MSVEGFERYKDNEKLLAIESSILESIPHAVIGLKNRVVMFANEGVYGIFGWKPKEIIGTDMRMLFHSNEEFEREGKKFYSILKKKKRHKFIFTFKRKNGSDVICMENAVCIGNTLKDKEIVVTHTDITKLKKTEMELRKSQSELQKLSDHLQNVVENERKRIAINIHDELGQVLTALKMDLWWLRKRVPNDVSLIDKISSMSGLIDEAIHSVQRISSDLRPMMLDNLGLVDAIEWYIDNFRDHTGINCEFISNFSKSCNNLDDKLKITIFRVIQETLTNVARHAMATNATIYLLIEGKEINLVVKDNGRGIDLSNLHNPNSFGILCVNERIKLLGGVARIYGTKNKGTTIKIKIPLVRREIDV